MRKTAINSQYLLYFAKVALLIAVYFAGGKLGLLLSSVEGIVTLVWPPSGIALAALLLFGYRLWPGIALGAFLVNISVGAPVAAALGISVGNTLEAVAGAYLLRRVARFHSSLERLQDVLDLVAVAAISAVVSSTIGTASLAVTGIIPWSAYGSTWWVWWLGDALGTLVVAPVLLAWGTDFHINRQPRRLVEAAVLLASLVVVSQIAFGGWLAPYLVDVRLSFTLLPFLVWAALRFGQRGAVTATLIGTGIAVWGTARGFGPFVLETIHLSLIFLGGFMGAAAVTAMLLAAAIAERWRVEEALRESQGRLANMVNSAMDAIITVDAEQRIILFNSAAEQMFRLTASQAIGQPLDRFIPERFRSLHLEYIRIFGRDGVTSRTMGALGAVSGLRADGEEFPIEAAISQIKAAGQKLYTVILRDITERKQAEETLRESERRARGIIDNLFTFVGLLTSQGILIEANRTALEAALLQAADVLGKPFEETYWWAYSPEVQAQLRAAIERGAAGASSRYDVTVRLGEDKYIIIDFMLAPMFDEQGQVIYLVPSGLDITERKQAEQAQRLLAEMGKLLTTSLDVEAILTGLLHLIVPALADRAAVDLPEANGAIRRVGLVEANPAQAELAERLLHYPPDPSNPAHPVSQVLRTGQPEIISAITDELLESVAHNAENLNLMRQLKGCSALVVPLMARGQPFGALSLLWVQPGRHYTQADLVLVEELVHRAALAIDNIRLYQEAQTALEAIRVLNEHLEQRVADRTAQLKTTNKKLAGEIAERQRMTAELAEIQHRLVESLDRERITLAQELHDGPVQELYSILFGLSGLKEAIAGEAELAQLMTMQITVQQTIQMLRTMFTQLRPPTLAPYGLEKAIYSHAEEFQAIHPELKINLELMADGQVLSERMRLALFRIYHESLNNIVRHARAQQVWIRFAFDEAQVILEIQDDGCGFEVPERWVELARRGHLGLVGMIERTEALGGQLHLSSTAQAGTLIRIVVPHSPEPGG